jgi:hypothetical protein
MDTSDDRERVTNNLAIKKRRPVLRLLPLARMLTPRHKSFALLGSATLFAILLSLQFASAAETVACDQLAQAIFSGSARISFAIFLSVAAFKLFDLCLSNLKNLELLRHKLKMINAEFPEKSQGMPFVEKEKG